MAGLERETKEREEGKEDLRYKGTGAVGRAEDTVLTRASSPARLLC